MPFAAGLAQPATRIDHASPVGREPAGTDGQPDRGADFVREGPEADGTWENHPGVTAMVAAALLRQTGVPRETSLQTTGKTLDYLRSHWPSPMAGSTKG